VEPLNSPKLARRRLLPPAALLTVGVGLMLAGSLPVVSSGARQTLSAPTARDLPGLNAKADPERPLTEEEVEEIRAACMRDIAAIRVASDECVLRCRLGVAMRLVGASVCLITAVVVLRTRSGGASRTHQRSLRVAPKPGPADELPCPAAA